MTFMAFMVENIFSEKKMLSGYRMKRSENCPVPLPAKSTFMPFTIFMVRRPGGCAVNGLQLERFNYRFCAVARRGRRRADGES
jgi:hypothetical protein